MDMCAVVVERLENLAADELAIESIQRRIEALDAERAALECSTGKHKAELESIVQEQAYLTYRLYSVALNCETIRKALDVLTPEQRRIFDAFYIHPIPRAAATLAGELDTDSRTINQQHHTALRRLAHALYGGVES